MPSGKNICTNELPINIVLAPYKTNQGKKYRISKISCARCPFIENMINRELNDYSDYGLRGKMLSVEEIQKPHDKKDETSFRNAVDVRCRVIFKKEFDLDIGVRVERISCDENLTPTEEEKYDPVKYINIFVDLGSKNSKWIITSSDNKTGEQDILYVSDPKETRTLCAEWGFKYDKEQAYDLETEDFAEWLGYAAFAFMRHIQHEQKAYVLNAYWAFPQIVGKKYDLDLVAHKVTELLRSLNSKFNSFSIVPEAMALKHMFYKRIIHLMRMYEDAQVENNRRASQESKNRAHNAEERQKQARQEELRQMKRDEWEKKPWIWKLVHSKIREEDLPPPYLMELKETSLGRIVDFDAFRCTGANSKGDFNLLILDAGGSTLDYCLISRDGTLPEMGSYPAGGNSVTNELKKWLEEREKRTIPFDDVESRKCNLCDSVGNAGLKNAVKAVYDTCLTEIAEKIRTKQGKICVLCSGMGMRIKLLRMLIKEKCQLPEEQLLLFSPDIFANLKLDKIHDYQDLHLFARIVTRNEPETGQPWPSADVVGGLFFSSLNS